MSTGIGRIEPRDKIRMSSKDEMKLKDIILEASKDIYAKGHNLGGIKVNEDRVGLDQISFLLTKRWTVWKGKKWTDFKKLF